MTRYREGENKESICNRKGKRAKEEMAKNGENGKRAEKTEKWKTNSEKKKKGEEEIQKIHRKREEETKKKILLFPWHPHKTTMIWVFCGILIFAKVKWQEI